jgi:hypothetical protein
MVSKQVSRQRDIVRKVCKHIGKQVSNLKKQQASNQIRKSIIQEEVFVTLKCK